MKLLNRSTVVSLLLFFITSALLSMVVTTVPRVSAAPGTVAVNVSEVGTITCNLALEWSNNGDDWINLEEWTQVQGLQIDSAQAFNPAFYGPYARSSTLESKANNPDDPIYKINTALQNGERLIFAYFTPVSNVDLNAIYCLDFGLMVQNPDNPTGFIGVFLQNQGTDNATYQIRTGQYNVATKSMTINNGVRGGAGSPIEIKNSSDPIASHSSFGSGGGGSTTPTAPGGGGGSVSAGPCAGLPSGPVFDSCYQLQFLDFTTVTFREEKYVLDEWGGGSSMRYYLSESYDSGRNTENTKEDCRPYFEIGTNGNDGQLDINFDNDGGDGEIEDFVNTMNGLQDRFTGGKYQDYDLACNERDDPYFTASDGTPSYRNVTNLKRMMAYSSSEKKIAFIEGIKPASEERLLASLVFTQSTENPNEFVSPKLYDDCGGNEGVAKVVVSGDLATIGTTWRGAVIKIPKENCSSYHTDMVVQVKGLGTNQTIASSTAAGAIAASDGGAGSEDAAEPPKTCAGEGGAMGWILCPLLDLIDNAATFLEDQIRKLLFVDPGRFDRDGQGESLYQTWSTFRGLATVVIVIIALVMIFSQAMGDGVFDNYSVKKLLPRLLIAGIGIQLSWFLLVALINIANVLGNGISGLIMSPFDFTNAAGETSNLTLDTRLTDILPSTDLAGQGLMAGIVAVSAFAIIGAIVPLAIGIIAALFVGFVTLVLRDIIIFLGIVFAPLAIAMSVLPGTQKTSKWWWESFEKALLLFPIVMVLLASGKIVSTILMQSGGPDAKIDGITTLAAIAAWYLPFFFLPKALQAGGSAVGKVAGLATDKSKGFFDRGRGWNDNRKKSRKQMKDFVRDASTQRDIAAGGIRGVRARTRQYTRNISRGSVGVGQASDLIRAQTEQEYYDKAGKLGTAQLSNKGWGSVGTLYFDASGNEINFKDAQKMIAEGRVVEYGKDRNNLTKTNPTSRGDALLVSAMANKMAAEGNIEALRIGQASANSATFNSAITANAPAVMAKAPDLIKGPAGSFGDFKAEDVTGWDKSTINAALRHMSQPGNYATPADHEKAWSTFGSALQQIKDNPQLKQKIAAGSVEHISRSLSDIAGGGSQLKSVDGATVIADISTFDPSVQAVMRGVVATEAANYNNNGTVN